MNAAHPDGGGVLDIATITRADHWIDDVLPRFAGLIDRNRAGPVRKHLLLLTDHSDADRAEAERQSVAARLGTLFDRVVTKYEPKKTGGSRLLDYDAARAGLVADLGIDEVLYLDPDTDVVEDLGEIRSIAPEADLLWVANPLGLRPVAEDLVVHGFIRGSGIPVVLLEPGFLYLRRDLRDEFSRLVARYPIVNEFAAGSTYWNMVMRSLGPRAVRLPDVFNRTFWDVSAAAGHAKTVHFTGRWKQLQPFLTYDRANRRIIISDEPRRGISR